MENQKENQNETTSKNSPHWGEHNPKLKNENFIDRVPKNQDDEARRNRPGTKEGESNLDANEQRGTKF